MFAVVLCDEEKQIIGVDDGYSYNCISDPDTRHSNLAGILATISEQGNDGLLQYDGCWNIHAL